MFRFDDEQKARRFVSDLKDSGLPNGTVIYVQDESGMWSIQFQSKDGKYHRDNDRRSRLEERKRRCVQRLHDAQTALDRIEKKIAELDKNE
jgi:hypothetical protein